MGQAAGFKEGSRRAIGLLAGEEWRVATIGRVRMESVRCAEEHVCLGHTQSRERQPTAAVRE